MRYCLFGLMRASPRGCFVTFVLLFTVIVTALAIIDVLPATLRPWFILLVVAGAVVSFLWWLAAPVPGRGLPTHKGGWL